MARAKITAAYVARASTKKASEDTYDTHWREPGSFLLRVTRRGVKSFCYLDPNRKRHALGRWPTISLDEALEEARRKARRYTLSGWRVQDLSDRLLRQLEASGASTGTISMRRSGLRQLLPRIGARRVSEMTTAQLQQIIDEVELQGEPGRAANLHAAMRALFADVVRLGLHDHDPSQSVRLSRRQLRRESDCTLEIIGRVWDACAELLTDTPSTALQAIAIRFQIVSLQRSRVICELYRPHLDGRWWIHPGSFRIGDRVLRTKNGKPQGVYLTPLLRSLLDQADGGDFPFAIHTPRRSFRRNVIASIREIAGVTEREWRPHDVRRVGATALDRAGVPLDHYQRLLSHTRPRSVTTQFYVVPEERDPVVRQVQEHWESILKPAIGADSAASSAAPSISR